MIETAPSLRPSRQRRAELGQFFTPQRTASFMAGMFPPAEAPCRLLDAGAGAGALTSAFLARFGTADDRIDVTAYEIDSSLHPILRGAVAHGTHAAEATLRIVADDFIEDSVDKLQFGGARYTHAMLNPPYKKIANTSRHRLLLRQVGIETVNLYAAFVALAIAQLEIGGQLVAIIPRSFCNGPYYRPFRDFLLARAALRQIHLFGSRTTTFKADDVLQENVILRLERGALPGPVVISTSTDDTFDDLVSSIYPFDQIVLPDDPERCVHIPTSLTDVVNERFFAEGVTLADLGLTVSTGPVVDFRLSDHLCAAPETGSVPLIYPLHVRNNGISWPLSAIKKPNAIRANAATARWLYPNGFYCVVRRVSSKEERRRIAAGVVDPQIFGDASMLGFENHLNVFHEQRHGLPASIAYGLTVFLQTTAVDTYIRRFNGHTQINATDLRMLRYPRRDALTELGAWAMAQPQLDQTVIDLQVERILR